MGITLLPRPRDDYKGSKTKKNVSYFNDIVVNKYYEKYRYLVNGGFIGYISVSNKVSQTKNKFIFNQYLEIGGRLQPSFANFNLDFLSKYGWVWEASSNTQKCSCFDF